MKDGGRVREPHGLQPTVAGSSGSPEFSILSGYRTILLAVLVPDSFYVAEESLFDVFLGPTRIDCGFLKHPSKTFGRLPVPSRPHWAAGVNPQLAYLCPWSSSPRFVKVFNVFGGRWFWDRDLAVYPA